MHLHRTGQKQDYLRENSIHSIGRYGAWEYSTMGQAITEGKQTAIELQQT